MSEFRVLLVYPNLQMVNLLPSNISILSACLRRAGFAVRVFDTTLYRTEEQSVDDIRVEHMQLRPFNLKEKGVDYRKTDAYSDFRKILAEYRPHLIGITATDDTFDLGMSFLSDTRPKDAHVVLGGVFPIFAPDEALARPEVDSICVGEGETTIVELCRRLQAGADLRGIPNLWVKDGTGIAKGPVHLVDLDELPYEDFSVFDEQRFFRPMQGTIYRMIPVSLDRGCPYLCAFCAAPSLRKHYKDAASGRYFRVKTVERALDEVESQARTYKADYLYFNSETFLARKEEDIRAFAQGYSRRIGLPFWCQTRIETITESRVKLLEDMNCDRISLGIEHGNEQFRRKILKKTFTNSQVVSAFRILGRSRIPVTVNNIIGFPDETRELAFDTIRLNRQVQADSINAYFFVPYRGTPLRQYCLDKGYIRPDAKADSLMRRSIMNMPAFTPDQIKGLVRTFPLYVKMPESYYDRIRAAERLDAEGDAALVELREIFFNDYFSKPRVP